MLRMANAASLQAVEVGKDRLREFLDTPVPSSSSSGARRPRKQAMPMSAGGQDAANGEEIEMDSSNDGGTSKKLDDI